MDKNYEAYTDSRIVGYYKQLSLLQPAETTILELLRSQLPDLKMLDIGIGGGRTTQHFAPLVKAYVAIDYSAEMIAACDRRFGSSLVTSISLQVGDARNMSEFVDNYFDFILFSFNGIDYASHRDRLQILEEIHRVGKTGSYFCFSSHNLQAFIAEFAWNKLSLNPINTYVNLMMSGIFRLFNWGVSGDLLKSADYFVLRDESHNFRLQTYYIQPQAQVKQLEPYFKDIKIYAWKTGLEISEIDELNKSSDMWLYYFCINRKV